MLVGLDVLKGPHPLAAQVDLVVLLRVYELVALQVGLFGAVLEVLVLTGVVVLHLLDLLTVEIDLGLTDHQLRLLLGRVLDRLEVVAL